jgi:hypothetical protein
MASNINPYDIDGTFPVAGQDNSSQGFRDNFTNIKNNFLFAQNEINDLQGKAILASALTGQKTINNDMAGTILRRPQLSAWTETLLDNGVISSSLALDFNTANFQKITTAGPVSLSFINWPTTTGAGALGYGVMRIWVVVTNASHTLTFPPSVNIGISDIAGKSLNNDNSNTITFDAVGNYIFDISSIDGGNNYLIFDVIRNRATLRDPLLYFNSQVNSTLLVGYGATALPLALALEQGEDRISVQGSYNSVSANQNYTGNVYYTQGDQGPTAGYSISGFRGNLNAGNIYAVSNNDFIGYINTLSMTGNGSGANTIQGLSSINFFATGSNAAAGLGGNIAIYTAPDQTGSQGFLRTRQAIGIENDQSLKVFGNLNVAGNATVTNTFKTSAGVVNGATYLFSANTSGANSFTANTAVSTIIIDSSLSATISAANINLPTAPYDRQVIKISAVAPITTANIYGGGINLVKYVSPTAFNSGNVAIQLTYITSAGTWYCS